VSTAFFPKNGIELCAAIPVAVTLHAIEPLCA
jgi:hypothetical protein